MNVLIDLENLGEQAYALFGVEALRNLHGLTEKHLVCSLVP